MTDPFFTKDTCDRCDKPLDTGKTMSWFTEETICSSGDDNCSSKEKTLRKKLKEKGDNTDYEGCGYIPK